jgi:hypothetical protein
MIVIRFAAIIQSVRQLWNRDKPGRWADNMIDDAHSRLDIKKCTKLEMRSERTLKNKLFMTLKNEIFHFLFRNFLTHESRV